MVKVSYVMQFCPECGSRLELRKSKMGKDYEIVLTCSKCGYKKPKTMKARPKITALLKTDTQKSFTIISKEDQKIRTWLTLKVECPKCGNNLVYVWQVQTRSGDEGSTQFMRCTKCDHTFREYT